MSPNLEWGIFMHWCVLMCGILTFINSFKMKKGTLRPLLLYALRFGGIVFAAFGLAELLGWV